MTPLFRRRYTVTLYTSEPGLDLRDEISEAIMDADNESIVQGTVETDGEEAKVSEEEAARDLDATEVGFASMSEEEFAELQKEEGE